MPLTQTTVTDAIRVHLVLPHDALLLGSGGEAGTQTATVDAISARVFLPLCCVTGEAGVDKKQCKRLYLIYFSNFFQWTLLMLKKLE